MDAIKNITERVSYKKLLKPFPNKDEMKLVYKAALRAPDHRNLKPSNFIEVTGKSLIKLSDIFFNYAKNNIPNITETKLNKIKNAPFRAPMVVVLISRITNHPKVPKIEQILSTGAATQNMLLALNALGYGAIWRTGSLAFNSEICKYFSLNKYDEIIGYLYIGTPEDRTKKNTKSIINDYVQKWT